MRAGGTSLFGEEDKGCDNCYYMIFDARAYPCSLCIRGLKRTDRWMPRIGAEVSHLADENESEYPND